jgi:NAD(P)H dehydrogenase (quinone)
VNRVPGGEGRMSFTYRPELGRAIATVLVERGHEGGVYDITTPDSVSMTELARIASDVTGEGYRAEPRPDEHWAAGWRAEAASHGKSRPA